jgi:hypothetical protein
LIASGLVPNTSITVFFIKISFYGKILKFISAGQIAAVAGIQYNLALELVKVLLDFIVIYHNYNQLCLIEEFIQTM